MALHWRVQSRYDLSFMVLWVIVTLVSGVDNSLFGSGRQDTQPIAPTTRSVEHYRLKRAADEEAIQLSSSEGYLGLDKEQQDFYKNENNGRITSEEDSQGPDIEEYTKVKQNYKQPKYLANNFKNFSSNKVKLESTLFTPNESFNEKQKSSLYSVSKYSSTNKKDVKLNIDPEDVPLKANYSKPLVLNEDKPKAQLYVDSSNVTKVVGEPQEMNDEPVDELQLNTTELIDDEILLLNSSLHNDSHNTTSADSRTMPSIESFDIILICSIVLGTVLLAGLIGGSGYVVYRRRIWNKPQTLSDKCSNADSSGYIDDSTLRENSEEMYSLDNDSFLNSLEAMTIQNYWTDNVKHTKL